MYKKLLRYRLGLVFCLLLASVFIVMFISSFTTPGFSAEKTQEIPATVEYIHIPSGNNRIVTVYTEELNCPLLVFCDPLSPSSDADKYSSITKGTKIYFRSENINVSDIDDVSYLNITSLRTDEKVILSLDDYNEHSEHMMNSTRCVVLFFTLTVVVISIVLIKKIRKINRMSRLQLNGS